MSCISGWTGQITSSRRQASGFGELRPSDVRWGLAGGNLGLHASSDVRIVSILSREGVICVCRRLGTILNDWRPDRRAKFKVLKILDGESAKLSATMRTHVQNTRHVQKSRVTHRSLRRASTVGARAFTQSETLKGRKAIPRLRLLAIWFWIINSTFAVESSEQSTR